MQPKKGNFTFNISTVLGNTKLNHKYFDSFLIEKNTVRIKQAESYTLHTVPRRHLFSLIAPQQPKNEITAMIAPTTMMMMDPVTYFTEDSST